MFSECKEGSNEKNFAKPSKTLGANSIRHNPYMAHYPPKIFRWRGIWEYHSMNIQSTKRPLMKLNFIISQTADRNKQLNICNYSKFHSWSFQNRHGGNVSLPLSISQCSFGKIYLPDPGVPGVFSMGRSLFYSLTELFKTLLMWLKIWSWSWRYGCNFLLFIQIYISLFL